MPVNMEPVGRILRILQFGQVALSARNSLINLVIGAASLISEATLAAKRLTNSKLFSWKIQHFRPKPPH